MKDNGVVLALGAMGLLVVGAGMRQRGSRAVPLELLSNDELEMIEISVVYPFGLRDTSAVRAHLRQHRIDPQDYDEGDVIREIRSRQEQWLTKRFGPDVGLNGDWSVSAWHVGSGVPNTVTGGTYILEDDDDTWLVVRRWYVGTGEPQEERLARQAWGQDTEFDDSNDYIEDLGHFESFRDLQKYVNDKLSPRIR